MQQTQGKDCPRDIFYYAQKLARTLRAEQGETVERAQPAEKRELDLVVLMTDKDVSEPADMTIQLPQGMELADEEQPTLADILYLEQCTTALPR